MLAKLLQFLNGYGIMRRFYYNKYAELTDSDKRNDMQHFPRQHMILATIVAFLTAIPALLWPTEPVAADRDTGSFSQLSLAAAPIMSVGSNNANQIGAADFSALQATAAGPDEDVSATSQIAPAWEMPVAKMMGVEITAPEAKLAAGKNEKAIESKTENSSAKADTAIVRAKDLGLKPRLRATRNPAKSTAVKPTGAKSIASKSTTAKPIISANPDAQPDFFADASTDEKQPSSDARMAALKLTLPVKATTLPAKQENWERHTVRKGDSLWKIFDRMNLNHQALSEVMQSGKVARTLNTIRPGDQLELIRTSDDAVEKLRYMRNRLEGVVVARTSGRLKAEKLLKVAEVIPTYAAGNISDSLFVDAKKAGLDDSVIMQLVSVFGWDIDFAQDIRRGDSFGILYEQRILDGEPVGAGKILAAHFTNRNRTYNAVHYTDSSGHSGYFTPDGRSMRKAFLRTPVDFARVSSHFNMRRKHPVLHTIRAHKGVDYAASRGTPIRASGDGKIVHKGRKGGYGRTVMIQHGQGYRTLYAHLNGYKRGLKKGAKVRQGDIIGYVGSSGLATGPHLHYEFHVNGRHKNPLTVAFPKAKPIPERERRKFLAHATEMTSQLASLRTTRRVAMRDPAK